MSWQKYNFETQGWTKFLLRGCPDDGTGRQLVLLLHWLAQPLLTNVRPTLFDNVDLIFKTKVNPILLPKFGQTSYSMQCAQIWCRCSHNYRSTSSPWEASRERRRGGARCPCFFLVTLAMLFLDFTLSVFESKLRIVFLSTPCKRGAKQTTISNLRNMLFKKEHCGGYRTFPSRKLLPSATLRRM